MNEFNSYCLVSGKLDIAKFPIPYSVLETNVKNEKYVRLLSSLGKGLIEQLIKDSGIEEFRTAITRYLTTEKRPLLFANLADDLQPLCIALRQEYASTWQHFESQPQDIDAIKALELRQLGKDLKEIGDRLRRHISQEVNAAVASNDNKLFEADYLKLKARMVSRLDELISTFSVSAVHQRAQASHPRNSVVPMMGVLAEGFYYLANELEDVLVAASVELVDDFFQNLIAKVKKADYYRDLYRLLGNEGGIEAQLKQEQVKVGNALVNEARTECDRYVRERPAFYAEGTISVLQLRATLHKACQGYDYQSMIEAEPAIRQLLKLDFDQKVGDTVLKTYRQTINQTINTHLLSSSEVQAENILQKYDQARDYLAQTLEKEAGDKIKNNQRLLAEVEQKIANYNKAIQSINSCLEAMQLDRKKLPTISPSDLATAIASPNIPKDNPIIEVESVEVSSEES